MGPAWGLAARACYLLVILWNNVALVIPSKLVPTIIPSNRVSYRSLEEDGHFYRDVHVEGSTVYVGARNYIFKIDLENKTHATRTSSLPSTELGEYAFRKPNFGTVDSQSGQSRRNESTFAHLRHRLVTQKEQIQLEASEKLAESFKLPNVTFFKLCERQLKGLRMYYGDTLSMPLYNASVMCAPHARGLLSLSSAGSAVDSDSISNHLFGLRTGIFGTLSAAPTGVNDFERGWEKWRSDALDDSDSYPLPVGNVEDDGITIRQTFGDLVDPASEERRGYWKKQFDLGNRCHRCENADSFDDPKCLRTAAIRRENTTTSAYFKMSGALTYCYKPRQAIDNMLGIYGRCDYTAAPNRLLVTTGPTMTLDDSPLPPTERETCKGGVLASTMFAGYHPDQKTETLYSQTGNGPPGSSSGGAAVYVLTEIGQEKQWDINHEMYMGFEDPAPTASSLSLAFLRLPIDPDTRGVDTSKRIVMSNPFHHRWVTSPATKFGRMVKTHNQAAVGLAPRAVALAEDDNFIYVFFREVDWESLSLPRHNESRYQYNWRAYDRTISFPWEEDRVDRAEANVAGASDSGRTVYQPEEVNVKEGESPYFSSFLAARVEGTTEAEYNRVRTESEQLWEAFDYFHATDQPSDRLFEYKGQQYNPRVLSRAAILYNFTGKTDVHPLDGYTRQYVYGPTLEGYDQLWREQRLTGRVARVCKNDAGFPMGSIDASFFQLDNHMSLSAFQTFLKTRLRCAVRVPTTPRTWRLRKDYASFWYNSFLNNRENWNENTIDWYKQNFPGCTLTVPEDKWYGERPITACGSIQGLMGRIFNNISRSPNDLASLRRGLESDTAEGCVTPVNYTETYPQYQGPHCNFMKAGLNVAFRQWVKDYGASGSFFFKEALFKNHMSGFNQYFWHFLEPKTYSTTSYYFSELRDVKKVGNTYYGTFTSSGADQIERLREASAADGGENDPLKFDLPAPTSALCSFSSEDLQEAFSGPFKKKMDGAYRPGSAKGVNPSPYTCDPDPAADAAYSIPKMNLRGTADDSFPVEDELIDFDVRRKSTRAAFLDGDDTGSRTMWRDVDAQPIAVFNHRESSVARGEKMGSGWGPLDKIEHVRVVTDRVYDVIYVVSTKGELYKVVTWSEGESDIDSCFKSNLDSLKKWWDDSRLNKDNEWLNYFSQTQEMGRDPTEQRYMSGWSGCFGGQRLRHKVLARIEPFDRPTKVWSVALSRDSLLLGTDEEVVKVKAALCEEYRTCGSCAIDPHCGWDSGNGVCMDYTRANPGSLLQNVAGTPDCGACLKREVQADLSNNVMLDVGVLAPERDFLWYVNSSQLEERPLRYLLLRNSSLVILGVSPMDLSTVYELKDVATGDCMIQYTLIGGECAEGDLNCAYEAKYKKWCDQYDKWYYSMTSWQRDMKESGCTTT